MLETGFTGIGRQSGSTTASCILISYLDNNVGILNFRRWVSSPMGREGGRPGSGLMLLERLEDSIDF